MFETTFCQTFILNFVRSHTIGAYQILSQIHIAFFGAFNYYVNINKYYLSDCGSINYEKININKKNKYLHLLALKQICLNHQLSNDKIYAIFKPIDKQKW